MMKRWLRKAQWLNEPIWARVPWIIRADYFVVPAIVWMLLWKQYFFAIVYFIFVISYRALIAFFVRRAEEDIRLDQEDWEPYLKAAEKGEWPTLPKHAIPPPPPDDEGPKAA